MEWWFICFKYDEFKIMEGQNKGPIGIKFDYKYLIAARNKVIKQLLASTFHERINYCRLVMIPN